MFFVPTDTLMPVFDMPGGCSESEEGHNALAGINEVTDLSEVAVRLSRHALELQRE